MSPDISPALGPGQRGAAGDINKPMMGERDQELDMLTSDQDQPVGSFPPDDIYNFFSKEGCDLAIAALLRGQIFRPGPFVGDGTEMHRVP